MIRILGRHTLSVLCLTGMLAWQVLPAAARGVPNFNLLDVHEANHELYRAPGRAVVLFFTGTGCPIARKSTPKLKELKDLYETRGGGRSAAEKPTATQEYLKDALEAFLSGKAVAVDRTRARGCRISYSRSEAPDDIPDYATEVAPLLRENCAGCHQPNGVPEIDVAVSEVRRRGEG